MPVPLNNIFDDDEETISARDLPQYLPVYLHLFTFPMEIDCHAGPRLTKALGGLIKRVGSEKGPGPGSPQDL